jgi:hypothetical protein
MAFLATAAFWACVQLCHSHSVLRLRPTDDLQCTSETQLGVWGSAVRIRLAASHRNVSLWNLVFQIPYYIHVGLRPNKIFQPETVGRQRNVGTSPTQETKYRYALVLVLVLVLVPKLMKLMWYQKRMDWTGTRWCHVVSSARIIVTAKLAGTPCLLITVTPTSWPQNKKARWRAVQKWPRRKSAS